MSTDELAEKLKDLKAAVDEAIKTTGKATVREIGKSKTSSSVLMFYRLYCSEPGRYCIVEHNNKADATLTFANAKKRKLSDALQNAAPPAKKFKPTHVHSNCNGGVFNINESDVRKLMNALPQSSTVHLHLHAHVELAQNESKSDI